jgi:hypothetical protein
LYCKKICDDDSSVARALHEKYGVRIKESEVVPFGRAAKLFSKTKKTVRIEDIGDGRCDAITRPALVPDGRMVACCGPAIEAPLHSPLVLGMAENASLEVLLEKGRSSVISNAIFTIGVKRMLLMLPDELQTKVLPQLKDASECSVCRAMTDDEQITSALVEVLNPLYWNILSSATLIQSTRGDCFNEQFS